MADIVICKRFSSPDMIFTATFIWSLAVEMEPFVAYSNTGKLLQICIGTCTEKYLKDNIPLGTFFKIRINASTGNIFLLFLV